MELLDLSEAAYLGGYPVEVVGHLGSSNYLIFSHIASLKGPKFTSHEPVIFWLSNWRAVSRARE
ncbi:MAG: hypothetical protein ABIJ47_05630 [Candidatus Bathyarchaeota archaeon]